MIINFVVFCKGPIFDGSDSSCLIRYWKIFSVCLIVGKIYLKPPASPWNPITLVTLVHYDSLLYEFFFCHVYFDSLNLNILQ